MNAGDGGESMGDSGENDSATDPSASAMASAPHTQPRPDWAHRVLRTSSFLAEELRTSCNDTPNLVRNERATLNIAATCVYSVNDDNVCSC